MSAYLDSSALVKLLINEPQSDALWTTMEAATPTTCRISYAEACAALARRERELPDAIDTWIAARARLAQYWAYVQILEVTQPLVEQAGEYAAAFSLRAYDAVQLAAAQLMRLTLQTPSLFLCYDRQLNRAARAIGLRLPADAPC